MAGLQIHLFQSLRLSAGATPLTRVGYPRQQTLALLAYLLLNRSQGVPRTHLAYILWPDAPEAQAVTNLRRALHALRRVLPAACRRSFGSDALRQLLIVQ